MTMRITDAKINPPMEQPSARTESANGPIEEYSHVIDKE